MKIRVRKSRRRGAALVWLVGSAALVISAMTLVLEVGWLNLCRSEVRVIVENAALAGARSWGPAADSAAVRTAARQSASLLVSSSTVEGSGTELASIASDLNAGNDEGKTNNNARCPAAPVLNAVVFLGDFDRATCVLDGTVTPVAAADRACLVQFTLTLVSPFTGLSRSVQARAVALWDPAVSPARSRLVSLTSVNCVP